MLEKKENAIKKIKRNKKKTKKHLQYCSVFINTTVSLCHLFIQDESVHICINIVLYKTL